jgi:hypothetical protein
MYLGDSGDDAGTADISATDDVSGISQAPDAGTFSSAPASTGDSFSISPGIAVAAIVGLAFVSFLGDAYRFTPRKRKR